MNPSSARISPSGPISEVDPQEIRPFHDPTASDDKSMASFRQSSGP
jgi:hypothetical protein